MVESLDRISRQAAHRAVRVLGKFVDEDVSLVTVCEIREYMAERMESDPMSFLKSVVMFIRGNEKSAANFAFGAR